MEHMSNIFSTSFGINFAKLTRVWLALISLTLKSTAYFFEPPCSSRSLYILPCNLLCLVLYECLYFCSSVLVYLSFILRVFSCTTYMLKFFSMVTSAYTFVICSIKINQSINYGLVTL